MFARLMAGCLVACVVTTPAVADEPKETKLKPALVFNGSHTGIREERFAVVTSEVGWAILWEAHRGDAKLRQFTETSQELNIDFEEYFVVAVFIGCDSALVVTTVARGYTVLIRFSAHGYQTEGGFPGAPGPNSVMQVIAHLAKQPTAFQVAKEKAIGEYCFVVLPKPVKTIIIEKDARRDLSAPPAWKEVKPFPAP